MGMMSTIAALLYLGWLLKDLEPRQILNLGDPDDV